MATPRTTTYTAASGASVYGGRAASYAWASALTVDAFTELTSTAFSTWATSGIPAGSYQGTDPRNTIVNAYCDPSFSASNGKQYFYGGGHGDGTCNAVISFDHSTLGYLLVGSPTPPSKYPPSYYNGGSDQPGPLTYPSGALGNGFFRDDLTDPADTAYNTARARASSHMYAAAAARGSVTHYFYLAYAEFDAATGTWASTNVDIGAQLYALNPSYNNVPLQQGTVAVYDDVTDRFYVTVVPGDAGGGWRSHIMEWHPTTRTIVALYESTSGTYGAVSESCSVVRVGRKLYCFNKVAAAYDQPQNMSQGFIFDMDAKTFKKFTCTGDVAGTTYSPVVGQETIPAFYDGSMIRRWNYASAYRSKIYSLNLTPVSGTGTSGDPYVLQQTERAVTGVGSMDPYYIYSRFVWNTTAGCALFIPRATQNWRALKLS